MDDLTQNTICTKEGYTYPVLGQHFKSGQLLRVDSSSHSSMLQMLSVKRCDYAIMSEFNAMAISNIAELNLPTLYRTSEPVNQVTLHILLRPELVREKDLIDSQITQMNQSGQLNKSLRYHTLHGFK